MQRNVVATTRTGEGVVGGEAALTLATLPRKSTGCRTARETGGVNDHNGLPTVATPAHARWCHRP
jgi:hypothetical protein